MGLFSCEACNTIENTATSRYWMRYGREDRRALCSACDPQIGKWHGLFPRRPYDPARDEVKNPLGA